MTTDIPNTAERILSLISFLDSTGFSTLHHRTIAAISASILLLIQIILNKRGNVDWHALVHSIVTATGAVLCLYLDIYAAESLSGTPEPLRMIRCEGPLTNLHKLLPAISLGYSVCDVIDGLATGSRDFLMHGLALGFVMGIVCELDVQHTVTQMLIMEVSTVPLNLVHMKNFGPKYQIMMQLVFAISFFFIRIIIVPYLWGDFVYTFYQESVVAHHETCFPDYFIYIVISFGLFFHGLNFYWFTLILKKMQRKLSGKEKMTKTRMD